MRKSRAFTMMELMVAVTIIIILFAILLPVYVNAKKRAHDPIEISRMRQVYTAFSLYTSDNADVRPNHFKSVTESGYISEEMLRAKTDYFDKGLGYSFMDALPWYPKEYLVENRSCIFSFESSTWPVVDFWAENMGTVGLAVSPIIMESNVSTFSPMIHIRRFARVNLDGSVVVREFRQDAKGAWKSVLLFLDSDPPKYVQR